MYGRFHRRANNHLEGVAMSGLPIPPVPQDGDFTQMAQLFIDTYEELAETIDVLKTQHENYAEALQKHIEEYQIRYTAIIKQRNEQLLGQEEDQEKTVNMHNKFE
jgi:predicted ribosome quality control (RQC) complex YloA/Tae2 family protein